VPLPAAGTVSAITFLLAKYVIITATAGMKMTSIPIPVQISCARKICEYFVVKLVMNVPNPSNIVSANTLCLAHSTSAARPENALVKDVKKTCMEPIHETWEGGRSRTLK